MTIRYHVRGGKDLPTYLCQRDGIAPHRQLHPIRTIGTGASG